MPHKKTVLNNVRVFTGTDLSAPQTVVIDGSHISEDASEPDKFIDGTGKFLFPGLIDAHVHLEHEDHLRQLTKHGVTTALDMAMWPASTMNGLRNKVGMSDMRSAGIPVTAKGSVHSCVLPLPDEAMLSGPEEADDFVKRRIDDGSDYIKVISDVPGPSLETLSAVVKAAHDRNKMVVAHAASFDPYDMALEAGADIVTHAPRDKPVGSDMIGTMLAKKTIAVPTLTMMKALDNPLPWSALLSSLFKPSLIMALVRTKMASQGAASYENAKQSVSDMVRAGVPILAGTDSHVHADAIGDVIHGESIHEELELLVDAGLSTVDALRAATVLPAQYFGLIDRGVIESGKRADLILLDENPLEDIRATRSIARVWCAGVEDVQ